MNLKNAKIKIKKKREKIKKNELNDLKQSVKMLFVYKHIKRKKRVICGGKRKRERYNIIIMIIKCKIEVVCVKYKL